MIDQEMNYVMDDYQKKSLFASFLPGIGGEHGIPLWCYYINRGQAISCFGVQDKDHSIMEFYPAHQAYERTSTMGFRTFLKINGTYKEAFFDPCQKQKMVVGMNSLKIEEHTDDYKIEVEYETLPGEPLAGLMRCVTITNTTGADMNLEVIDGMAEVIPYGVNGDSMKSMGQTTKAWMQVLDLDRRQPKFKVRVSMEDTAQVSKITNVHFALGREQGGSELLPVIVDRNVLFQFDSTLLRAYGFMENSVDALMSMEQSVSNDVPTSFFGLAKTLKAGASVTLYELYGMSADDAAYDRLLKNFGEDDWFENKKAMAKSMAEVITRRIATKTGDAIFDAYCRMCYLDNLLRGGYPVKLGKNQVFYLYSRKHGDMERDYNFFSMLPEYYSQGNGNFRDVNQNRRSDILYSTFVGDGSIKTFYNALQINGYNPLGIEKITYRLKTESEAGVKALEACKDIAGLDFIKEGEFTPGQLYKALEDAGVCQKEALFEQVLDACEHMDTTNYGEGYWCDHWTYNLDLVDAYLSVYPENKEQLLYHDHSYLFTQARKQILPRVKRYTVTDNGVRQYNYLKDNVDTSKPENRYLKTEEGILVRTNLIAKMFTLTVNKMSALDPYGMGIEMEGGKPGWYDALNGLPGLLGSSMAETYETYRMVCWLLSAIDEFDQSVDMPAEVDALARALALACNCHMEEMDSDGQAYGLWTDLNDAKEAFWEKTAKTISGTYVSWNKEMQKTLLGLFEVVLRKGIEKAQRIGGPVCPTYFYYEVTQYEKIEQGLMPCQFQVHRTPDFLEGSVHMLKLDRFADQKQKVYDHVRNSRLYDQKLKMYKVNASLSEASFELGRACAFTPGWLENESVWLHMEYKYLLELLKSGMYEKFADDFHDAAVPFLEEAVYGRSLLENSSFIASSTNPNQKIHGKGFVARLSGSTAEFLQIWQLMMFGPAPFVMKDGQLTLNLQPCVPSYLVGEEKEIEATFLGSVYTVYKLGDLCELIPGKYQIHKISLEDINGEVTQLTQVTGDVARALRDGTYVKMTVECV
ncbi:MAG: hypothetical protein ACLU94_03035 [Catenibacillus sp.]